MSGAERDVAPLRGALRVPLAPLAPGVRDLPESAASYVARVHRLVAGDRFVAFDPEGAVEADAEIVDVGRRAVTARLGEVRPAATTAPRALTLIQGACKGDKMDAIIRDATELGATRIVPAIAERSVARPEPARAARWRRIAVEAARQCGRGDAPAIASPIRMLDALEARGDAVGLCLDPRAALRLGPSLGALRDDAALVVVIGPEGGLSDGELIAAERCGFARVTMGPLVLRTETVCAAVLGALLIAACR